MEEPLFDRIADEELHRIERALSDIDPDELEVEYAAGVLSLVLADGQTLVVNSHRAARQIWLAAFRQAWHFTPGEEEGVWRWRTEHDELHATLSRLLSTRLGREIRI